MMQGFKVDSSDLNNKDLLGASSDLNGDSTGVSE